MSTLRLRQSGSPNIGNLGPLSSQEMRYDYGPTLALQNRLGEPKKRSSTSR
jgi:hypothetical protein